MLKSRRSGKWCTEATFAFCKTTRLCSRFRRPNQGSMLSITLDRHILGLANDVEPEASASGPRYLVPGASLCCNQLQVALPAPPAGRPPRRPSTLRTTSTRDYRFFFVGRSSRLSRSRSCWIAPTIHEKAARITTTGCCVGLAPGHVSPTWVPATRSLSSSKAFSSFQKSVISCG